MQIKCRFDLFSSTLGAGLILIPTVFFPILPEAFTPAKWMMVYFICFFLAFQLTMRFWSEPFALPIPILNLFQGAWLVLLIVFYLNSLFIARWKLQENQLLDLFCSGILFISGAAVCLDSRGRERIHQLLFSHLIAWSLVFGWALLQIFELDPFPEFRSNPFPSASFGFQNMAAEFFGLSVIVFIIAGASTNLTEKRSRFMKIVLYFFAILSAWMVYRLDCRSVLIAAFASVFLLSKRLFSGPIQKWTFGMLILVGATIGIKLVAPGFQTMNELSGPNVVKKANTEIRMIRWMNTLSMIMDRPNGVGAGGFEYGYLPYSRAWKKDIEVTETLVPRSPHNGYLEAASESGVPFAILLVGMLFWALRRLSAHESDGSRSSEVKLAIGVSVFVCTNAFFAFPMENAYPFYLTWLVLGMAIPRVVQWRFEEMRVLRFIPKSLSVLATVAVFCLGASYGYSSYVGAEFSNEPEKLRISCNYFPSHWKNCVLYAQELIRLQKPDVAEALLRELLKRQPENFAVKRILAYSLFEQRKEDEACILLGEYDFLFENRSSLHEFISQRCF